MAAMQDSKGDPGGTHWYRPVHDLITSRADHATSCPLTRLSGILGRSARKEDMDDRLLRYNALGCTHTTCRCRSVVMLAA